MAAWENPSQGQILTGFSEVEFKFGLPTKVEMEKIAFQESISIPLKDAPSTSTYSTYPNLLLET